MTLHRSCNDSDALQAYYYLVALGIGYLFTFASLTLPIDYWQYVFPTYKDHIEYAISAVYVWVNLIALFLVVLWGGTPVFKNRIYGGFFCQFAVLVVIPTAYFIRLSEFQYFCVVIGCTAFVSGGLSLTASAAIAFTAQYPIEIQSGYQMGIGLSALMSSMFRIFTKLALPTDAVTESGVLFFYLGALVIVFVIYCYKLLLELPCSKKYIIYGISPDVSSEIPRRPFHKDKELTFFAEDMCESSPLIIKGKVAVGGKYSSFDATPSKIEEKSVSCVSVFHKIYWAYYPVFTIYSVTLMLWPPLITEIPSYNYPYLEESQWWSLILLFLYALMDCVGRFFVGCLPSCLNKYNILQFALCRSLVIFPLLFCVKGYGYENDFMSIFWVSFLGVTNGYLGSTAIMLVNEWCESQEEIGQAGVITSFVLNAALAVGSLLGSILHAYIL